MFVCYLRDKLEALGLAGADLGSIFLLLVFQQSYRVHTMILYSCPYSYSYSYFVNTIFNSYSIHAHIHTLRNALTAALHLVPVLYRRIGRRLYLPGPSVGGANLTWYFFPYLIPPSKCLLNPKPENKINKITIK